MTVTRDSNVLLEVVQNLFRVARVLVLLVWDIVTRHLVLLLTMEIVTQIARVDFARVTVMLTINVLMDCGVS